MEAAEEEGRLPAEDAWEAGPAAAGQGEAVRADGEGEGDDAEGERRRTAQAVRADGEGEGDDAEGERRRTAQAVRADGEGEGDDAEGERRRTAQALIQAFTADDLETEALAEEEEEEEKAGEAPAAEGTEPQAEFTLDTFLGEWWDSLGNFVRVSQGSAEGMLDVTLTKKRAGRGPIKLKVTDQGEGCFACGQYLLERAQSSAGKLVWQHRRVPSLSSTWSREAEEEPAFASPFGLHFRPPSASGGEPFVVDFETDGADGAEHQDERVRTDPYPYLTKYYTRQRRKLQETSSRYYAGGAECTDDGHPERSAMRNLCVVCLGSGHMARDCPKLRCEICFCQGHEASECGRALEKENIDAELAKCWSEALAAVGLEDEAAGAPAGDGALLRCVACGTGGAGHANCVPGPPLPAALQAEEKDVDEEMPGAPPDAEGEEKEDGEACQPRRKRPRRGGVEGEEAEAEEGAEPPAGAELVANADEVTPLFARWAEPCDAGEGKSAGARALGGGAGRVALGALEAAVLRLLADGAGQEGSWREELSALPPAAVAGAARSLRRSGAILPGSGLGAAPQLTALGHWLAPLPLPPSSACALLQGALWGVLLPMAALVVLLESVPPDMALGDGTTPPRKSGHFALAAAYFRWREGRETWLSRRFGANIFWETVDQRIVAICKHAQQALHYDGDDAAFEEMDGELMDVRRRDGRPWTCASAFGGESSNRWARFCAALSAAFAPQPGDKPGEWIVRTPLGEGVAPLDTTVSPGHALLFAAGQLEVEEGSGVVELDGVRGTLCGGEGALEEASALRQELGERLSQALEGEGGRGPRAELDEGVAGQALQFLSSSASEFTPARSSSSEPPASGNDVGSGVLALLGRQLDETPSGSGGSVGSAALPGRTSAAPVPRKEASILELAARCLAQPVEPGGEADVAAGWQGGAAPPAPPPPSCPEPEGMDTERAAGGAVCPAVPAEGAGEESSVQEWATALAQAALLRVLKRRAAAAEDYSLAAKLKAAEASASAAAATARGRAGAGDSARRAAALERLAARKRKAVEEEDYDLASRIKQQEAELASRPSPPPAAELERVRGQKLEAIAREDYTRAAALRQRQMELEAGWKRFEGLACAQAAGLLADPLRRRSLVSPSDPWASFADAAVWAAAGAELRAEAGS